MMEVNLGFADDRCKQLLMNSETLADTSAEYERCGNISRAITACQQAIG